MKEGWTYKKLGEVCEVISGQSPDGKTYNNDGIGTPFYQGKKDFSLKFIGAPTTWTTQETKIAIKDDILMSVRAPVGDVNYATQRVCIGRGLAAIRPGEFLDKDFLFYFLLAEKKNVTGKEGAVFPSINRKEIMDILISYPSINEQQRIVERLDAAFENIDKLKANAEKQLAEAQTLFQKSLAKAMEPKEGWKEKNIGELTDSCLGKMLDKQKNKGEYQPYLRNINVRWGEFDLSDILEMKFEDGEDERYGIQKGDLIICEGGEPGRCAIWEGKMENMKIQKALHRVRSKGEILNRYLYFSIMYYAQSGFLEKFESGATIKHLTGEALRKIPLSYPPLTVQQRIVERLDALSENIRKYEEIQRQIISECDALKQALLRKVFE